MPQDIPTNLRAFITEHISSILQLELLLLLAADSSKAWTAEEVAKVLYVSPDATLAFLEALRARGFCDRDEGLQPAYRFAPKNEEWRGLVSSLATLYKERRLTVTDLIYAGPAQKYQSFADAFRVKKEK